ncbi:MULTISPECIES: succinate dehydrogenase/fumarate reductase iron-sulfur subunit [Flagellimonas]|uniref:Succinate dehydrogenase/fumarate reductase iron-sulfur subunit n=2 Tax=Flagellimonas TaxID=444459 RepID=A0A3A1ND65_9FLAO|nr:MULTISPECIES: succinate dehydrogenase/fumarate reductase iron-sulfur subunit [Allomuricauda]MBW8242802.1 succinate dehydrogenase/fumarate reductase iron-sulfur subunit [Allomuricauda oceani]QII45464.1 succinate dehydrogenase/fumarate reductase iron-sulfur subunit [Allomuricauda oceani]RIV42412.1 succinate dehydrogenase/fumarate reductase iron-sulfur subunit [Allomuricauda maritima]TXJ91442.1 succinate dehydrogenase/fumarate reductase iron-sulfur subunit [Allomuricauda maritima]|tara:strand:+ start:682 stop:1425 length:744 start_codon:yes stop_codon:yes gene_type:complete
MKVTFKIWRQENRNTKGAIKEYKVDGLTEDMSFLEALDHLNELLVLKNEKVIAYEYDCREGICGQCGVFINGRAHGPHDNITTCQLHMRSFKDGDTIVVEPWRAASFPVLKDLIVDRSAFDRIMEQGGYITAKTGTAPEANAILIPKEVSDSAMDVAACIGCGACAATCKNASAALFASAKINHLNNLPQGHPEAHKRVQEMTYQMELEGFGSCSFTGACEVECPEGISITNIAEMYAKYTKAKLFG